MPDPELDPPPDPPPDPRSGFGDDHGKSQQDPNMTAAYSAHDPCKANYGDTPESWAN